MKIAVTSTNGKTICGHAGRCPSFLVYEISKNQTIHQTHIKLNKNQTLNSFPGPISSLENHPLAGIHTFITQQLGEELKTRLILDGIQVVETEDDEPLLAVNQIELTRH